jgi:hypothetical protein
MMQSSLAVRRADDKVARRARNHEICESNSSRFLFAVAFSDAQPSGSVALSLKNIFRGRPSSKIGGIAACIPRRAGNTQQSVGSG